MIYLAMALVPVVVYFIFISLLNVAGYPPEEAKEIFEAFDAFIFGVIFYIIGVAHAIKEYCR